MRQLLVEGDKTFRIEIPDDAKITFGPWSPPRRDRDHGFGNFEPKGTLRIYQGSKENIVACFSGVTSFREIGLSYQEQVVREEGATIWKDDEHGYVREHKQSGTSDWVDPAELPPAAAKPPRRARKAKPDADAPF